MHDPVWRRGLKRGVNNLLKFTCDLLSPLEVRLMPYYPEQHLTILIPNIYIANAFLNKL